MPDQEPEQKPDPKPMTGEGLTPKFNQVSGWGKATLYSSTLVTSVSGILREDTAKHPLRYPFYVGYMALLIAPVPMIHLPVTIPLVICVWAGLTPWSRWARDRLKADFNSAAMVEKNREFLVPKTQTPPVFKLRTGPMLKAAAKITGHDVAEATRSFMGHFRR